MIKEQQSIIYPHSGLFLWTWLWQVGGGPTCAFMLEREIKVRCHMTSMLTPTLAMGRRKDGRGNFCCSPFQIRSFEYDLLKGCLVVHSRFASCCILDQIGLFHVGNFPSFDTRQKKLSESEWISAKSSNQEANLFSAADEAESEVYVHKKNSSFPTDLELGVSQRNGGTWPNLPPLSFVGAFLFPSLCFSCQSC